MISHSLGMLNITSAECSRLAQVLLYLFLKWSTKGILIRSKVSCYNIKKNFTENISFYTHTPFSTQHVRGYLFVVWICAFQLYQPLDIVCVYPHTSCLPPSGITTITHTHIHIISHTNPFPNITSQSFPHHPAMWEYVHMAIRVFENPKRHLWGAMSANPLSRNETSSNLMKNENSTNVI